MINTENKRNKNFEIPNLFNGYQVIEEIANGDNSSIFKVKNISTNKYFCAKIYEKKIGDYYSNYNKMISTEIEIHRSIKHPNIVQFYEAFDIENERRKGFIVIIEEYCPIDLIKYVNTYGFKDEMEKRKIIKGIINAVSYLHQKKIAHCDIKIDNILLDENHSPKLCDFNHSLKIYKNEAVLQQRGTNYYMPPELRKSGFIDYLKCDIWSIGITLYVLSENGFPYRNENDMNECRLIIEMKDKTLKRLIHKCTAIDPKKRIDINKILSDIYFQADNDDEEFISFAKLNTIRRIKSCSNIQYKNNDDINALKDANKMKRKYKNIANKENDENEENESNSIEEILKKPKIQKKKNSKRSGKKIWKMSNYIQEEIDFVFDFYPDIFYNLK